MRSNFILLFPLFIFCLFNSYPITQDGRGENCSDFKISTEIRSTCYGSANGSIALQIKGGSPPYRIQWSDGKSGQKIRELGEGEYPVEVTDSKGCEWKELLKVKSYKGLTASIKEAPSSIDTATGSLEIIISGGDPPYIYNWIGASGIINQESKPSNKLSNLPKGKYAIAVTDNNRCTSVFNATVY